MNFEYCECGCHGSSASAGPIHFWIFNDLKGNYFLHRGHGWISPLIGKYKSYKEADAEVVKIVKKELAEINSALKPKKSRSIK